AARTTSSSPRFGTGLVVPNLKAQMPTYIALLRYTQQGITDAKNGPARLDAAKEAYRRAGGELKAFYLTMGQYDGVAIADLPDDTTAARLVLAIGAQGNLRSETMKAFTEAEYKKIMASLPCRPWSGRRPAFRVEFHCW